jgi:putative tryptophan/tyrosine transport system substrate-binding protein
MRRREFITLLGGAAAWPVTVRAQQPAMAVVGYFHPSTPETGADLVAAFRKGLSETGYVEGRNVTIEYAWAHNESSLVPALAAELVRRRVSVIVAAGFPQNISIGPEVLDLAAFQHWSDDQWPCVGLVSGIVSRNTLDTSRRPAA